MLSHKLHKKNVYLLLNSYNYAHFHSGLYPVVLGLIWLCGLAVSVLQVLLRHDFVFSSCDRSDCP
jgi:hypothetical protein